MRPVRFRHTLSSTRVYPRNTIDFAQHLLESLYPGREIGYLRNNRPFWNLVVIVVVAARACINHIWHTCLQRAYILRITPQPEHHTIICVHIPFSSEQRKNLNRASSLYTSMSLFVSREFSFPKHGYIAYANRQHSLY